MYRSPATPPAEPLRRGELAYPVGTTRDRGPGVAALQLAFGPFVVAAALALVVGPQAGLAGLVGTSVLGVWGWRRASRDRILFRVEGGRLVVGRARKAPLYEGALSDLLDVALDTKQIQMVQEGGSAIPAVRYIESRVGPELDRARLELVVRGSGAVTLTKDFGPHMEAAEWAGKIRSFLRKQGWVPADERDEEPPSEA